MKSYVKSQLILLFIMALFSYNISSVSGQCSGLSEGMGSPTTSAGTITTTVTWSTEYRYINGDLTIGATGVLNISDTKVKIGNDLSITVVNGGVLNITNDSYLYGEPDGSGGYRLWDGILVEGGGTINMDGSQIYYAKIAIQANNSGSQESVVTVAGSCFENNEIGIYFGPNELPDPSTSEVESSEFKAPDLVDELDNQVGDYGILVFLDDATHGIQIGSDDEYDSGTDNYFHHYGMAIRSKNSDVTVQNCKIQDIDYGSAALNFPAGSPITETFDDCFGICATGTENISIPPYLLTVGDDASTDFNNVLLDVRHGIYAEEYVNTEIHFNDISSTLAGTYVMDNAIQIRDYDYSASHDIKKNEIVFYVDNGIELINVDDGSILIDENSLSNSLSDEFGNRAIRVTGSAETDVTISNNIVSHAITGILINGTDAPEISGNTIDFYSHSSYAVTANGIHILNCEDAQIFQNIITGNCTSGACSNNVRGITIDGSLDCDADKNIIYDCSVPILLLNTIEDINLSCNEIHDCNKGALFFNVGAPSGDITNPTSPGDPSDNGWYPELTAERVRTDKTVGGTCNVSGIVWYYDDDETWSDISGLTVAAGGSVLPTFTISAGDYCDQPLRQGEIQDGIEVLSYYFGNWADEVAQVGIYSDINHYYKAWNFWDYLKNDEELQSGLEGDLATAFQLVQESNIPTLDEIRHMPGNSALEGAIELNASINSLNGVEETWVTVNDIYYGNLNTSGRFIPNNEAIDDLREIAELSPFDYGFGVHNAWKLLDTVIHITMTSEERLAAIPEGVNIYLYPNPAWNYFSVEGNFESGEYMDVSIYNIDGRCIFFKNGVCVNSLIDISQVPAGVYQVNVKKADNTVYSDKIVIFKPDK